jgi:hypothetical protein
MIEFLIKRTDGDWFDLHKSRFAEVLRPSSFPSRPIEGWGDHRIEIRGCPVSFSYEGPGIQVCFEGNAITEAEASQIVGEIAQSITKATSQKGEVVPLTLPSWQNPKAEKH